MALRSFEEKLTKTSEFKAIHHTTWKTDFHRFKYLT